MSVIKFDATLININDWIIIRLPTDKSAKLTSRGQVMVKGTINNFAFIDALEPDGNGGHWLLVNADMQKSANVTVDDTAKLSIELTKDWPEPTILADWQTVLDTDTHIKTLWLTLTPMARWEWLRWISSTANVDTRKKRIEVSYSKLRRGERRPCCFNRSMCCVPQVSKSGVLIGAL